jgi:hypothetical protein
VYFILGLCCATSWFDCKKLFTALRGQDILEGIAMTKRMKYSEPILGNIICNYVLVFLPEDG